MFLADSSISHDLTFEPNPKMHFYIETKCFILLLFYGRSIHCFKNVRKQTEIRCIDVVSASFERQIDVERNVCLVSPLIDSFFNFLLFYCQ